jgi:4-hydroxybenzoate polyprenyltransferase
MPSHPTESVPAAEASGTRSLLLLLGLAASALVGVAATQSYLRLPFDPIPVGLVTASALFIYALNRVTDRDEDGHNDPRRARVARQAGVLAAGSGAVLLAGMIGLQLQGRSALFYLAVLLVGLAYSLRLIPWYGARTGLTRVRLKDVVVTKSAVVAAVWTGSVFGAPLLHAPGPIQVSAPYLFLGVGFFLAYFANVVYCDMRDVPGDRAAGVMTMPVCFGVDRCHRTIAVGCGAWLAAAGVGWRVGWIDSAHLALSFLANGIYPAVIWYLRERTDTKADHLDYAVEALVPAFALGLVLLRLAGR